MCYTWFAVTFSFREVPQKKGGRSNFGARPGKVHFLSCAWNERKFMGILMGMEQCSPWPGSGMNGDTTQTREPRPQCERALLAQLTAAVTASRC